MNIRGNSPTQRECSLFLEWETQGGFLSSFRILMMPTGFLKIFPFFQTFTPNPRSNVNDEDDNDGGGVVTNGYHNGVGGGGNCGVCVFRI